ncbi:MAG: GtrA family protein [Methylophilaceae bacterium]|nr:GtrA family protein [Methylophilaceae bacterium]
MKGWKFLQFIKFLSVGVANTLVGLSVIYSAKWFFNVGDVAANALGYSVGLLVSFTLNSRWTFAHQGPRLPAMLKFLLVSLVAYGMNLLTVMIAIHYVGLNDYIAQALGIPPYTLTSFFASKYLVFRTKSEPNERLQLDNQ